VIALFCSRHRTRLFCATAIKVNIGGSIVESPFAEQMQPGIGPNSIECFWFDDMRHGKGIAFLPE